jgi:hypothetical protein
VSARIPSILRPLAGAFAVALSASDPGSAGTLDHSTDVTSVPFTGPEARPGDVLRFYLGNLEAEIHFAPDTAVDVDLVAWVEIRSPIAGTVPGTIDSGPVFALAPTIDLDGTIVTPSDLVTFDATTGNSRLLWRGADAGVPPGVAIDAVAHVGGDWLLSFDVSFTADGQPADDEDILLWRAGQGWIDRIDLSDLGVERELDLDALEAQELGRYWISFDGSGVIPGPTPVPFDDEDVLLYEEGAVPPWTKAFDGNGSLGLASAVDLDAVGIPSLPFADGFETGGTDRWSSVAP